MLLASGISTDDICVVTALRDERVGVLWSNQKTRQFGFRTHLDGTDPTMWSPDEVPAWLSALDTGRGMADDHLNVAVASDNTLYAAVKTSYDTPGYPKIALLVRRPSGLWDPLYEVDQTGTRPIVLLNEERGFLRVCYTAREGYNDILFRESSSDIIQFGPRQLLLPGSWNNVTGARHTLSNEMVVLAADGHQVGGILETFTRARPRIR